MYVWECICVSVELSAMELHHLTFEYSYSHKPVINITIRMLDTADGYKILFE